MALEIIRRWLSLCLIVLGVLIWLAFGVVVALNAGLPLYARVVGLALCLCILTLGALAFDNRSKR